MSNSYSWEGKGRYGSSRLRIERVDEHVKLRSFENTCHTCSASVVVIHEEALYQVCVPIRTFV